VRLAAFTVVAAAAGLAGCASSSTGSPAAEPAASAAITSAHRSVPPSPWCSADQLSTSIGHTAAAGGQQSGYLVFTNVSRTACHVSGWPTLVAVRPNGSFRKATHVASDALGGPRRRAAPDVVLQPGARADAVFAVSDNPRASSECPTPYRYLLVEAPRISRQVRLSAWSAYADAYLASCYAPEVTPLLPSHDLYAG
jgi:Protein of unknown function (DUF4232)